MRNKKKFATSLLCGMSSFMLAAVPVMADAEAQKYTNTDFAMDTVVSETLYTTGEDLNTTIGDKLREIETGLLSWTDEDSQISKLNASAGETTEVSDELPRTFIIAKEKKNIKIYVSPVSVQTLYRRVKSGNSVKGMV